MALDALGIIVLVFILLGLIKLLFFIFSPKSWMNFAKGMYKNPAVLIIIELILAAVVLYYLLMYMTIVQIFGGIVLGALLTGLSFACFGKELVPMFTKMFKAKGLWKKIWLIWLVWLALFVWVLLALF